MHNIYLAPKCETSYYVTGAETSAEWDGTLILHKPGECPTTPLSATYSVLLSISVFYQGLSNNAISFLSFTWESLDKRAISWVHIK